MCFFAIKLFLLYSFLNKIPYFRILSINLLFRRLIASSVCVGGSKSATLGEICCYTLQVKGEVQSANTISASNSGKCIHGYKSSYQSGKAGILGCVRPGASCVLGSAQGAECVGLNSSSHSSPTSGWCIFDSFAEIKHTHHVTYILVRLPTHSDDFTS